MEYKYLNDDFNLNKLKKFTPIDRKALCAELRDKILSTVAKNGGHLASNLGVVELTVALLTVFNADVNKMIFDVGHQSYAYKLLTGRLDRFDTLRQANGISGFPRINESKYDHFDTGHSATAVSAAIGYARANRLNGKNDRVIALIGDGAMTGGPAYEAINDLGHTKENVLVILNDNEMSINKNVGGLSKHLSRIRLSSGYINAKHSTEYFLLRHFPNISKPIVKAILAIKDFFRFIIYRKRPTIFEDLGLVYYGPVDGHNVEEVISALESVQSINAPVLLHVCTCKGKGYSFAEDNPSAYHGVSPFDVDNGVKVNDGSKINTFTDAFSHYIIDEAESNQDVVTVCAAMDSGTGLVPFSKRFPDRFFDCGIAEEHCVTMASGLALGGKIPVVAIYSTFLQRAFDQILEDVCFMNSHVVFILDRAGFVGSDGHTHNGLFDISYMLSMPNIQCFVPCDYEDLSNVLHYSINSVDGPVSIRFSKSSEYRLDVEHDIFKPRMLRDCGNDFALITCGTIQKEADVAFEELCNRGYRGKNINLCSINSFDSDKLAELIGDIEIIFTLEEGIVNGGFGSSLARKFDPILGKKVVNFGIEDSIVHCGTIQEQIEKTGLDGAALVNKMMHFLIGK